jgi:signal peptidase I
VYRRYVETLPDGVKHDELKATDEGDANNTQVYVVPPDHVFAMGDNRDNSADSRFLNGVGFVPVENLIGRAEIIFFSMGGDYPWWQFWQWPFEIRWDRLLMPVR